MGLDKVLQAVCLTKNERPGNCHMIEMKRSRSYQLFVYIIDLNEKSLVVDTQIEANEAIQNEQRTGPNTESKRKN